MTRPFDGGAGQPAPPQVVRRTLKVTEKQEALLRRLGSALVLQWDHLPDDLQDLLIDQALIVTDRASEPAPTQSDVESFIRTVKTVALPPPAPPGRPE